jgi:hypothetical protein
MSVPTHNLYDFVHLLTKKQYILFYYYTFGSRDLHDVFSHQANLHHVKGPMGIATQDLLISKFLPPDQISLETIHKTQPIIFCHDQEPLNFDLYLDGGDYVTQFRRTCTLKNELNENLYFKNSNLRWVARTSIQKSWTLLHSELNSDELSRYESTGKFTGAYWWSHAIIARDWYRFAEHDNTLVPDSDPTQLFLMYCRDTSGSREYRKEFLQLLEQQSLLADCQIESFNGVKVDSNASAIYDVHDHNSTAISVVLETVFDKRIHLTEKILRPIACGHPFILAAGPGSLRVLRNYGFHTFTGYINESYDDIHDSSERLAAIAQEMKRIQQLKPEQKKSLFDVCRNIASYNQKRLFSKEFFNQVCSELETNVAVAQDQHKGELDLELWWNTHRWYINNGMKDYMSIPIAQLYRKIFLPAYRQTRNSS